MAVLLTARALGHAFAARALFDAVSFTIQDGDRIGLIGPNGAGKSTLMKILAGQVTPDQGDVAARAGVRVGYLAQSPAFEEGVRVREAVAAGVRAGDHDGEARVDEVCSRLDLGSEGIEADTLVGTLSGGWQKRVALAREIVAEPDLLLLDEPTNHLDVESIEWLERFLGRATCATITVTHDRYFLQKVARRILDLDRRNEGGLFDVDGDYATYLERKAELMQAQERAEQTLRNTLRRETEWLRRGPKARTTKSQARIDRAGKLAADVAELTERNRTGQADIELEATGRRTKRLIEATGIAKHYGEQVVFEGVDLLLGPGSRLAVLGPNGCGKSTLLRVLVGREAPSDGTVKHADDLRVRMFEQNRESLDPEATLADAVSPGSEMVDVGSSRLHRHGYLQRFLFRPDQMRTQVKNLSGGEQSRLLIARLMLEPADILVLDEPTNDLDFQTLDVLQQALERFEGTVLLVSHDRYFVDQVATKILAFHTAPGERGRTTAFADLYQWERFHAAQEKARNAKPSKKKAAADDRGGAAPKPKKLTYKDQRDWDTLEGRILEAETQLEALEAEAARPEVASDGAKTMALHAQMTPLREAIERMYERWAELEAKRG